MNLDEFKNHLPDEDVVIMPVGPSGSGKSTFARSLVGKPSEHLSSDGMREQLTGDPTNQEVTGKAFGMLNDMLRTRCEHGCFTVYDATNLKRRNRRTVFEAATEDTKVICVLIHAEHETCKQRQTKRARQVPEHVIDTHYNRYKHSTENVLEDEEPFDEVWVLNTEEEEPSLSRMDD